MTAFPTTDRTDHVLLQCHSDIDPLLPPGRCSYAQVVIRDPAGNVFQVTDNEDDDLGWEVPTWRARKDQAPHEAAQDAARHDVGTTLDTATLRLLVVDHTPAGELSTEASWFVFDGGVLPADRIAALMLPSPRAIDDGRCFTDPKGIRTARVQAALTRLTDPSAPVYLVDGEPAA
ncbi:hypothetical protein ABTY61_32310 [Kitasatospora sp. NPDC096128]|uniref:hypothetical protein n=1 Tax=Kitasatospora sp. NPDC096128 TaxID=3155547 RepID=UPI0033267502